MNFGVQRVGSGVLATFLLSTTAMADVSPRDVWESWRDYIAGSGYDISASESTNDSTLSISDIVLGMELPEDEGTLTLEMGDLQFVDNGDGTVEILMPDNLPIHLVLASEGETVDATVTLTHSGLSTIVSGTPDEMEYTYSAASLNVALTQLIVEDTEVPDMIASADLEGLRGRSKLILGEESVASDQAIRIDRLSYMLKGADPEGSGEIDMAGSVIGLDGNGTGFVPLGDYSDDPAAMFAAGFEIAGTYAMESSEFALSFVEDGTPGNIMSSSGAGGMTVEMNDGVMAYAGSVADLKLQMMVPDLPLPIDISFGKLGFGLDLPLKASDTPQDFGINLTLADLAVSEMIWSMFDPGQVLPHDPATLLIDIVGKATVLQDLFTVDENSGDVPGELNALALNGLELKIAGASLAGNGAFTFDNSDMDSFDGMPRPEGMLNLNVAGVNGLMDKLIQMGLLPEEQAMGARMMMSMVAVPGPGEDELKSTIEINDQGHVLANGQRLR